MLKFFKPEDFHYQYDHMLTPERASDRANAKLEAEGKVVYNTYADKQLETWQQLNNPEGLFKIKALLINIEPVEECKHPEDKISTYANGIAEYLCRLCGTRVKPTKFEEIR